MDEAVSPNVSVIILNWNSKDFLDGALRSLYRESTLKSFETIVVDNASSDGSVAYVESEWPQVRLIKSPANVGWAGGNNLGLAQSRGEHILLLNSDIIVRPTTLSGMSSFLDVNRAAGCVGCRVLNEDLSLQRSVDNFPSVLEDFLDYSELHRVPQLHGFMGRHFEYWGDYDVIRAVGFVLGACMMVRRQVLEEVGPLDAGYFIYADEIDWCYRMAKAGWRTYYIPTADVIHIGGASMDRAASRRVILKLTSQYRFYWKHYSRSRRLAWRVMLVAVAAGRLCLLLPLASLPRRPDESKRPLWWEVLTREPIMVHPKVMIRTWWRVLVFVAVRPKSTNARTPSGNGAS